MPLVGAEAADEEEDDADADVGEDDAHPDLVGQRVHEAKDVRLEVDRLLDHDGNAQGHKRLGEVHHSLSVGRDRQRGDGHIGFLQTEHQVSGGKKTSAENIWMTEIYSESISVIQCPEISYTSVHKSATSTSEMFWNIDAASSLLHPTTNFKRTLVV